jgi:hypothetical protein
MTTAAAALCRQQTFLDTPEPITERERRLQTGAGPRGALRGIM